MGGYGTAPGSGGSAGRVLHERGWVGPRLLTWSFVSGYRADWLLTTSYRKPLTNGLASAAGWTNRLVMKYMTTSVRRYGRAASSWALTW